jgi:hypothetical protein
MMKLTRVHLLRITMGLGLLLVAYSLVRHFTGIALDEGLERFVIDGVIMVALVLFIYNRKLAGDEKKERERGEDGSAGDKGKE